MIRFLLIVFVVNFMALQSATAQKSIFDVMNYKEVLTVNLEADFAAIDTTRREDKKHKAVLSFEDEAGVLQTWNVSLKARGKFRRLECEMVPLKVNFKKKALAAAGLSKFDDMKLVTHCVSSKTEAKALLQKEYLAYKLYNELTEYSYRVQLLKINYIDVNTGKKSKHWAFLIEDTAELRDRIGATASVKNTYNLPRDTFHEGLLKIVSVFQYMIGNSDWDLQSGRNVKYILREGKVIPIPYDFDFSGLVNASYAIPNPNYGLTSVRERTYLGFAEDLPNLKSTFAFFKINRSKLLKKVNDFRGLDEHKRLFIIEYLDSFYQTFNTITVKEKVSTSVETPSDTVGEK